MAKRPPCSSPKSPIMATKRRPRSGDDDDGDGDGDGGSGVVDDCISALPDDILLRVLSFLPISAVARTSALSRRWRFLWTAVPSLNLHHQQGDRILPAGISYADSYHLFLFDMLSVVSRRSADRVRSLRFLVDHPYADADACRCAANEIAAFALRKGAEEIFLDFSMSQNSDKDDDDITECLENVEVGELYNYKFLHRLPLSLLNISPSTTLRVLQLKDCRIQVSSTAAAAAGSLLAPQLETLWLTRVYPAEGDGRIAPLLDLLIAGCPKLKNFRLEGYPMDKADWRENEIGFLVPQNEDLRLTCPQLKHLCVRCCHCLRSLQIDAPRLESLQHVGEVLPHYQFVLLGSPALVRAKVVFCNSLNGSGAEERNRVLQKLSHVQFLTIQSPTLMDYLAGRKVGDKALPVYRQLRNLEMQGNFPAVCFEDDHQSISEMLSFLGQMPILENLTLGLSDKISPIESVLIEKHFWDEEHEIPELEGVSVSCLQNSLKTIKITDFYEMKIHITLVKYLLRNSLILEEMWIRSGPALYADHLRIHLELLKLRANPNTKITMI